MTKLADKVVLITGIGSGIGLAAARLFYQSGATVFGIDRDVDAGRKLQIELANGRFFFWEADLSNLQTVVKAVEQCVQRYGTVDVLYNNAGISFVESFTEVSPEELETTMAVNFYAVFYLCQQVLPVMVQQGSGTIINTASELAVVAQPHLSAYCASKGAVLSLTRSLALEYAHTNIHINALCPGPTETQMLKYEFDADTNPAQAKQESINSMPIRRLGTPEEVAQVALFLASDAPRLMHGATLLVDGGKTII